MKRVRKALLHNELNRMIRKKEFWAALAIGCGIAIWHFVQHVVPADIMGYGFPMSAYIRWMGADAYEMQSYWYYLILPLLAAFPYAGTFFSDLKTGYVNQIFLRGDKKEYFRAKFLTVFLSGGIVCVFPLILNFLLTATVCPLLYPDVNPGIGPNAYCFGSILFFTRPFFYWLIYLVFDFAMCGFFACAVLSLTFFVDFRLIALLLPFGIYYFLMCLGGMLGTEVLSANYFLISGEGVSSMISIIGSASICGIIAIVYVLEAKRFEAASRL